MEWHDIVFELLEDEMIKCKGCDGLMDANYSLNGLLGMSEITPSLMTPEFIVTVINASIDARNRYTWMNRWDKIPHIIFENNEYTWEE